jgi:hypothetical protein
MRVSGVIAIEATTASPAPGLECGEQRIEAPHLHRAGHAEFLADRARQIDVEADRQIRSARENETADSRLRPESGSVVMRPSVGFSGRRFGSQKRGTKTSCALAGAGKLAVSDSRIAASANRKALRANHCAKQDTGWGLLIIYCNRLPVIFRGSGGFVNEQSGAGKVGVRALGQSGRRHQRRGRQRGGGNCAAFAGAFRICRTACAFSSRSRPAARVTRPARPFRTGLSTFCRRPR